MRYLPEALLVLSLPAGIVGFVLGARLVAALSLPSGLRGIVQLVVPLFVGGLFMLPFVIPFFDRMAKRDLAAHRREVAAGRGPVDTGHEMTAMADRMAAMPRLTYPTHRRPTTSTTTTATGSPTRTGRSRTRDAPATRSWIAAQNELTERVLAGAPARDAIRDRLARALELPAGAAHRGAGRPLVPAPEHRPPGPGRPVDDRRRQAGRGPWSSTRTD